MPTPILATKLFIPPLQPKAVLRPRLVERINEGLHRRLTLISAPAGFGKTTLVSEWVASAKGPAAWLSLDEGDNDPTRFLTYFVAALQTIAAKLGDGVLGVLQTHQTPPSEALLTALLNEMTSVPQKLTLILDDYHVIDSKPIDTALTFMLEHLPPQMHLIIATREDPQLPLAQLRGRGQLTELRVADLRFTPSEAADFVSRAIALSLSTEQITALQTRTEGWIAGLQLAVLSMQGHKNIAGFIKSFTGNHHFVMDYLVEQVLQKQSDGLKRFLLCTSILDRLCGPLCDAILLEPSVPGQKTLEYIERANLFIVPLDHERRWYRYHHLFADLLRQRLYQSATSYSGDESVNLAELHLRASYWYEDNDLKHNAIQHAFAGEDFERAANLIELSWAEMDQNYHTDTWLDWVKALPQDLIRKRPVLSVGYAWALLDTGDVETVEALLQDAEQWLKRSSKRCDAADALSATMVVVDQDQFRSLPATIADARATRAFFLGDIPGTLTYAQQALSLVPDDDHFRRGAITGTLAATHWMSGEIAAAYRAFSDCMDSLKMAGKINLAMGVSIILADIRCVQGRLHDARRLYEPALQLAAELDQAVPMAGLYVGLSMLNREQGDLNTAIENLQKSKELGEHAAIPDWQYRWHLATANIKKAQKDLDGALEALFQAERLYSPPHLPDLRPIAALKTRILVAQGRLTEAQDWIGERGLSAEDDLSFMQEFEHITLARVLMAAYKAHGSESCLTAATELLERLETAAKNGERTASVIEILVLQALAHQAQNNIQLAIPTLARALAMAAPQGYVQIFADEGIEMAELLSEAAAQKIMPDYVSRLLAVVEADARKCSATPQIPAAPPAQSLIEPLSERELQVLRLIARGLSNRQIGERLFLALDTVKGHNRNIFGKLQVHRRTEAVAQAQALGLL